MECNGIKYGEAKTCKSCHIGYKATCSIRRYLLDSSLFLEVIFYQKKAKDIESYIYEVKKTGVCFVSHIILGEIFNGILKEYYENQDTRVFEENCNYARELLEGVYIIEIEKEEIREIISILRENDSDSRDKINLILAEKNQLDFFVINDGSILKKAEDIIKINNLKIKIRLI